MRGVVGRLGGFDLSCYILIYIYIYKFGWVISLPVPSGTFSNLTFAYDFHYGITIGYLGGIVAPAHTDTASVCGNSTYYRMKSTYLII